MAHRVCLLAGSIAVVCWKQAWALEHSTRGLAPTAYMVHSTVLRAFLIVLRPLFAKERIKTTRLWKKRKEKHNGSHCCAFAKKLRDKSHTTTVRIVAPYGFAILRGKRKSQRFILLPLVKKLRGNFHNTTVHIVALFGFATTSCARFGGNRFTCLYTYSCAVSRVFYYPSGQDHCACSIYKHMQYI